MPEPHFDAAVKKIMKEKGVDRKSAEKIVGSIETKRAKLKIRIAGIVEDVVRKRKAQDPLVREVPFGKENRTRQQIRTNELDRMKAESSADIMTEAGAKDVRIKPLKPTQKDRNRIISAKEEKIAKEHEHRIVFKAAEKNNVKSASLESMDGHFAKYWLLNAKQVNGNGWGVTQQSIAQNIKKFVGRPFVITAKQWVANSEYEDNYEHPYIPTNDMRQILAHQEKFRVGTIKDVFENQGDYYASIQINPKYAGMRLPPFCSPAIYQNNPSEHEGQLTDWEALHLAGLTEDPAYGARIALLKGTCIGTSDACSVQFKSAKLETVCPNKISKLRNRISSLTAKFEFSGDEEPNEYGETGQRKRARILIDSVQKNRKLQKHMNSPEGRKANKLFVDKGIKINPSEHLKKLRMQGAALRSDTNKSTNIVNVKKKKRPRYATHGEQNMTFQKSKKIKIHKKKHPEVRK